MKKRAGDRLVFLVLPLFFRLLDLTIGALKSDKGISRRKRHRSRRRDYLLLVLVFSRFPRILRAIISISREIRTKNKLLCWYCFRGMIMIRNCIDFSFMDLFRQRRPVSAQQFGHNQEFGNIVSIITQSNWNTNFLRIFIETNLLSGFDYHISFSLYSKFTVEIVFR